MSSNISRRTLAKGVAWSAPVVAASATIPAYAASPSYEYLWGNQALASYYHENNYYGDCTYNYASVTTENLGAMPWASGHGITYNKGAAVDTTATIESYTIDIAFPKGTTTGNWTLNNSAWSVERLTGVTTFADTGAMKTRESFNVSDRDVYRFTFNGTKTARVSAIGSATGWPGGAFTAVDENVVDNCSINPSTTYYMQFSWSFSTANGFKQTATDAMKLTLRS